MGAPRDRFIIRNFDARGSRRIVARDAIMGERKDPPPFQEPASRIANWTVHPFPPVRRYRVARRDPCAREESPPVNASETITPERLRELLRPCVYQFMKEGKPLYIGSSAQGLVRVLHPNHHRRAVRKMADEIRVEWFVTEAEARTAEKKLVSELRPPLNGRAHELRRVLVPTMRKGRVVHVRRWVARSTNR